MPEIIPNWHPIFVHFTVALLVTALIFQLASLALASPRKDALAAAARWNLAAGAGFTLATVATGLLAYYSVNHDAPSHLAMTDHRNWALSTAGVILVVAGWACWRERRLSGPASGRFAVLLGIVAVLVGITAFKGGELVYRYGLGVMSMPTVDAGDSHEHDHDIGGGTVDNSRSMDEHNHADGGHDEPEAEPVGDGDAHQRMPQGNASHVRDAEEVLLSDDPSAVADLLNRSIQHGNQIAVLEILAPDILIFESGNAERSADEYQGHHMPADMAFLGAMEIEILERKQGRSGESAWVSTRSRLTGTFRDSEIDLYSTETLMMQRQDGRWQVTHIHWSSRPAGESH